MTSKCKYCGREISKKAVKIHQRNCKRMKKPLKRYVHGLDLSSELLENLHHSTGKNQDELQMGFTSAINRAVNENPEKFQKTLKEKGYDV